MASKFYLRNLTAANPPTAGEKSSVLPVDTLGANNATGTQETRSLDPVIGTSETSIAHDSDATTAARDNYLSRFTSKALGAQTIPAQTWTLAVALAETNNAANSFLILSVYVWRPSTSSVVGYIYDSHTSLGSEWSTGKAGRVVTFSGAELEIQEGDVLVLEVWRHAVQAMAAVYTQTVYFDGTVDVTEGGTGSAASYLESPADIPEAPTLVNKLLTLKYDLRQLANKLSTLKYKMGGVANKILTLKYNLREFVNKLSTLKYQIINSAARIITLKYSLGGVVNKIISLLYRIFDPGFVSDTGIFSSFFFSLAIKSVPKTTVVIDNEVETDLESKSVAKTTVVINNDYVHMYPEFIAKTISLLYNILVSANKATTNKYNIRELVDKLTTLKNHIFQLASKTISLLYKITGVIAKLTTIRYKIREFVDKLAILKYSIFILANKLTALKYDVAQAIVNKLTTIKYDVVQSIVNKLTTIKYNIRKLISKESTLKYIVRELISKSNIIKYAVRVLVSKSVDIKYKISQLANKLVAIKNKIAQFAGKATIIRYNMSVLVAKLVTLKYKIQQIASRLKTIKYNIFTGLRNITTIALIDNSTDQIELVENKIETTALVDSDISEIEMVSA